MSACSSVGGTRPSLLRSIVAKNPGPMPQMPGAAFVGMSISSAVDRAVAIAIDHVARHMRVAAVHCGMGPGFFATIDRNKDGLVPPTELQADIRPPDIVYSERMRITLGGRTVDLIHPGLNHSDDATVMLFRNERVLFGTEFLADALVTTNPRSLPSTCSAFDRHPLFWWIRSYRTVEALDFDRVAPGHGDVFDKAVVTETREYWSIWSRRYRPESDQAGRSPT